MVNGNRNGYFWITGMVFECEKCKNTGLGIVCKKVQ